MDTVKIGSLIERLAPLRYAYDWDNCGFNIDLQNEVENVLVCVDVTDEIINEAIAKNCGLIISHHPLIFSPIKKIDQKSYVGKCAIKLIANGISLYCAHTSIDNAKQGINDCLADIFCLNNRTFIKTEHTQKYYKVGVYVPKDSADIVREEMAKAGAGKCGNYSDCSFSFAGEGRFLPCEDADPYIGKKGELQSVLEVCIQALVPQADLQAVLSAIKKFHPYEEPAIDVNLDANRIKDEAGIGIVGDLEKSMSAKEILEILKTTLELESVRFCGDLNANIGRLAVCGGSGGDLVSYAKNKGAQMYITGEVKHNFYVESDI